MNEEKYKIVPVGQFIPYTLDDLSVVIPQCEWHKRRINWFIPQFIQATPPEVIKNTIVVYDGDEYTKNILDQYHLKGVCISSSAWSTWSTYKMEIGFKEVRTRLCVRMHNDTYIARTDWAQSLIDQFNADQRPQLIGAFNWSGGMAKERILKVVEAYPVFREIYDKLIFENESIGSTFMTAFCMAGQTYVMQGIYPQVIRINKGKMDEEDCLFTLLASINNIKLTAWNNMYDFIIVVGKPGEWEEETLKEMPIKNTITINDSNRNSYPKTEFKEVVYGY